MKRYFFKFLSFFYAFFYLTFFNSGVLASSDLFCEGFGLNRMSIDNFFSAAKENVPKGIIRKIVFGNGIEYVLKIILSPESIVRFDDDNLVYRKGVAVEGTYFMDKSENIKKELASYKFKCTFTYDKKSFCKIADAREDILCETKRSDDNKWKIKQSDEILYSSDNSVCTVSLVSDLYKNAKFSTKSIYYENTHLDFICSKNGTIVLNSNAF